MDLPLDRDSDVPLFRQISRELRRRILDGRLPGGVRLPPERTLARDLGVHRGTVLEAYRDLKADGLVDARVGSGTVVVGPRGAEPNGGPEPVEPFPWRRFARQDGAPPPDPLLRDLLELTEHREVISLSVGLPAPELLPLDDVARVQRALLDEVGPAVLLHGPTEGLTPFRETLAALMAGRSVDAAPDEILVTAGSQQGLDLVARAFLDPGDLVIVEEPSYFGALQTFRAARARLLAIPMDGEGMRVDILESVLARSHPKLIYTLPTFQNPSGALLSAARRAQLVELAARHQVPLLEDDPYFDLYHEQPPPPPLKALDRSGTVLYLSSFSKMLFPGLRIGWIAAPRDAVRRLTLAKQTADLHSGTLSQWILQRYLATGSFPAHLARVRAAYRERRDALDRALRRAAPPELTWQRPSGGFYLWCRLPVSVPESRLLARAAERQVAYIPGGPFFADPPAGTYLRLNFSFPAPAEIEAGARRLAAALRDELAAGGPLPRETVSTPPIV